MSYITNEMLEWLNAQVGVAEVPNGSNNVKYNQQADEEMWPGYHPRQGQPWCGTFIDVFFKRFKIDYPGSDRSGHFYTPSSMVDYRNAKRLLGPNAKNVAGCVVFFKWNLSTTSPICDHVGFVLGETGDNVHTIEGNLYNKVMKVSRVRRNIVGFGVPFFPIQPPTVEDRSAMIAAIDYHFRREVPYPGYVSYGSKHYEAVRAIQWALASEGVLIDEYGQKIPIEIDGIFGPQTKRAVEIFQGKNQLLADGIVGPITWTALNLSPIE